MNPKFKAYKGSQEIDRIYRGGDKIYKIYRGSELVWRDRAYDKGQVVFKQAIGGDYTVNLLNDGVYKVTCVGAGGTAVYTAAYDDIGYLATGGSGGCFVGNMKLTKGTYSIHVGLNNGTNKDSSISGVVTAGGGGNGVARLTAGAGGSAPVLSLPTLSVEKNLAGNAGGSGRGGKGGSIPPVRIQRTISVYNNTRTGAGAGGGGQASEYISACYLEAPIAGLVIIEYVQDDEGI